MHTIQHIQKRNGAKEPYQREKITKAIAKAFTAVLPNKAHEAARLAEMVERRLQTLLVPGDAVLHIEIVQDTVEEILAESGYFKVSKAYILYRHQHSDLRDDKHVALDAEAIIDGYLGEDDWRTRENSNVQYSIGGLILHSASAVQATYWLNRLYPNEVKEAHTTAALHIHDLGFLGPYCAGWSLQQLIREGLGGVKNKITSAPAKHLSTLCNQMVNFLGILQNEFAGAQAFASFDTYLAPFVKVEKLRDQGIRQALQSFLYGVNTPSRWGSQAPFTNITLDWTVPVDLAEQSAIVEGKEQDFTYGDCQQEMDRINKIFMELMIEGDAVGRGFQYPIPTYNITKEFDFTSDNAKALFSMASKHGTPYFQNFINSDLDPRDVRSMCCRLQLDKRELRKRGGGLFGSDEFTGSIGVVTINLPQIAHLAADEKEFMSRLDRLMDIASTSLEIKRKVIQMGFDRGLYPYTKRYLANFNNHFSTIGIVGMHEACLNLLGKPLADAEGKAFAERVLEHMREKVATYQETTGNLYNLEATPAESASYRLAKHDKARFPAIVHSGQDIPYYTNSSQLPVSLTDDVFAALDHQEALQAKYTGGTVMHVHLGEEVQDWTTTAQLVKTIATNYRLPYFTISPVFSICPNHGYLSGSQEQCPYCGTTTEIYARIVGYYRSVENWNKGKQAEFGERKHFVVESQAWEHTQNQGQVGETSPALAMLSILLFTQPNCAFCKPMADKLTELDLPLILVNVTDPAGEAQAGAYGIRHTPTALLLDQMGNVVARWHRPSEVSPSCAKIKAA